MNPEKQREPSMDDINYPWTTACEENGGNINLPDPNKAISSSTAEVKGQQAEAEQPEKREDMSDKNSSAAAEVKGQQSEAEGVGTGAEDDPKGAAGERKKKRKKAQGVTGGAGAYTENFCDKSHEGMKSHQLKFFVGQCGCEGGELDM